LEPRATDQLAEAGALRRRQEAFVFLLLAVLIWPFIARRPRAGSAAPGCGVMVGVKEGKVIATHGDMKAEVNRGLNCVKGYFLSKIMYGADRLTQPLLRKKNGVRNGLRQGRRVHAGLLGRSLRHHGRQGQADAEGEGADGARHVRLRPVDDLEGYAATKLMRAGFRSNNLDPNARHCMASAAYAFMRTFGMDEPMGCYDDFEATPTPSCSGARTWRRCTRSCGRG
jgi:nitrate reductase NapA